MKEFIVSPFYSIIDNKLLYLGKYEICKLPADEEIKKYILINEGVILKENEIENKKCSALVLEPHPDDFALSALGYTLNRYNTIVCNIFSKTNINSFTWIKDIKINEKEYESLRLGESKLSIEKLLKQQFVSLKEESTRITKNDNRSIEEKILNFTKNVLNEKLNIDTILVPMGIGNHPDHLIVHNTIMNNYNILNKKTKIILYPEFPYARCKKDYINRLEELNSKYKLKKITIDVEDMIETIVDAISIYRSQFDDINRNQMLAIVREDCRALAQENKKEKMLLVYYEIEV